VKYVREVMMMGALTLQGSRHGHHRTPSVGVVCAAAIFEVYIIFTVTVGIPKDEEYSRDVWRWVERFYGGHGVVQWHDALLLGRRILFLVLPIMVHFVLNPSSLHISTTTLSKPIQPGDTAQASPESLALSTLQALVLKLQLLRLTRGAITRNPKLRAAAENYWTAERQEGEWVRNDEDVQRIARSMGLGFDEASKEDTDDQLSSTSSDGPLLKNAKTAVQNLLAGFLPSSFWGLPQRSPMTPQAAQPS